MAISDSITVGNSVESPSIAPLIEFHGIRKTYQLGVPEVHARRWVSVRIAAGDFGAIIGASGSGKSTFINILGCLDKPTAGQYLLHGIDVSGLTKKELARIRNQKIGFVFQNFNLLGRISALENTEVKMLYSRVSKKNRESRHREALAPVGLADRQDHFPSQLSGGQQQRLAISRALTNQPERLVADEPTSNLDSRTAVEIIEIFQRLNAQGPTIVLVTHEPDIAQFAKREIVFRDGQIKRDEAVPSPQVASEGRRCCPRLRTDVVDMAFSVAFQLAIRALARNKLRSTLTMLGIVIGLGAVIAVVGIGRGAAAKAQEQLAAR